MRAEVGSLATTHPEVFDRTSYVDVHTLTGVNACGLTTRFPHYFMATNVRSACEIQLFARPCPI